MKSINKKTIKPVKKMKVGGTSSSKGLCPDGYYWSVQGCQEKLPGYKKPFSSTSSKIGAGTLITGLVAAATEKIGKKIKSNQANKKEAAEIMKTVQKANLKKKGGIIKSKKK
jgi:hypothetical protein